MPMKPMKTLGHGGMHVIWLGNSGEVNRPNEELRPAPARFRKRCSEERLKQKKRTP